MDDRVHLLPFKHSCDVLYVENVALYIGDRINANSCGRQDDVQHDNFDIRVFGEQLHYVSSEESIPTDD